MRVEDLLKSATISYAQNREDLILAGFFKDGYKGFYVDVGANDPMVDSVTKYFYERGWTGMNIEPIKSHFADLEQQRPNDININIGISDHQDKLTLREYKGSGLSTFAAHMKEEYEGSPNVFTERYEDYQVDVVTLKDVFSEHKPRVIDFLKVDVEGYEYEVLNGNDWDTYRPRVICIESNHIHKDWRPLLKRNGYVLAYSDGLNGYYIDERNKKNLREFSYIKAVIFREPIVNYTLLPYLSEGVDAVNGEIGELKGELALKDDQIRQLEETIDAIMPLRKHIRRQIRFWILKVDRGVYLRLKGGDRYRPTKTRTHAGNGVKALEAALQTDAANFERYNSTSRERLIYRVYMRLRGMATGLLRKVLRKIK